MTSLILCALAIGSAPQDEELDLSGVYIVTEGGRGAYKVKITQEGTSVSGQGLNDQGQPDWDSMRGTLSGTQFTGTLTIFYQSETTGRIDRNISTNVRLTLSYDAQTGVLRGERDSRRYEEEKREWKDEGRGPVSITYEPVCKPLTGFELGKGAFKLRVSLSEPVRPLQRSKDSDKREGFCHYREIDVASLSIKTGDIGGAPTGGFAIDLPISGCDIDLYLKEDGDPNDPKSFREVRISWADNESGQFTLFNRWGIRFILYAFYVKLVTDDSGALKIEGGSFDVQMAASGEAQLLGPVYLGGSLSGIIRYKWNNAQDWTAGTWEFSGLGGVQLQVRRNGITPIATLDLSVNSDGEASGALRLNTDVQWRALGYTITLDSCSLFAKVHLRNDSWAIERGEIRGTIAAAAPSEAKFQFILAWQSDRFRISIANEGEIRLFGGVLRELGLEIDLDPNTLDFTRIEGRLRWERPDFGAAIQIDPFLIENGELKQFEGSGEITYEGFTIDVRRLRYESTPEGRKLSVQAKLQLGWSTGGVAAVDIQDFTIAGDGRISSFRIEANVDAAPVSISFRAAFENRKFIGEFRGRFAGTVEIKGAVVVGAEPDFRYGYLKLEVTLARGIPIGGGLQILGLNGAFGFNYLPENALVRETDGREFRAPEGGIPRKDTYYLAGGITIGDMAGLASLNGTLAITLGSQSSLEISGTLQITQSQPYFRGTLSCAYALGSPNLHGSLESTVKIPTSGSIIDIQRNRVLFGIRSNRYSLEGNGLGGRFFSFLTVSDGRIQLEGSLSNPIESMQGSIRGRLSGGTSYELSKGVLGFTLEGGLRLEVVGSLAANLNPQGTVGEFDLTITLQGRIQITTPAIPFIGSQTWSFGATARAGLKASRSGERLRLRGNLTIVTDDGESYEIGFDETF